ncbi:Transmembrane protein 18 [Fragilaria crotonensis]|nr:Transmembrane protein 18 [Fragilaria crotonensis]
MASEGTFERLVNHILESAEQIATRFEEGMSVVMTGKLPGEASEQSSTKDSFGDTDDILMDMDEGMMGSPLEGIADGVLGDIMSKQSSPQTTMEHLDAFRSAIRWGEPFIISLVSFQVVMFFLCLWASRKGRSMTARIAVLLIVAVFVRCAEMMNAYGARNWEALATQNYFDRSGIFVGLFFSGPLLLDSFMMLMLMLREASNLLIEVKQMEIKKKQQAKKGKKEGGRGQKSKESTGSKKED